MKIKIIDMKGFFSFQIQLATYAEITAQHTIESDLKNHCVYMYLLNLIIYLTSNQTRLYELNAKLNVFSFADLFIFFRNKSAFSLG
jgi:hypothetical protein